MPRPRINPEGTTDTERKRLWRAASRAGLRRVALTLSSDDAAALDRCKRPDEADAAALVRLIREAAPNQLKRDDVASGEG